jgi:hypothetical protein
MTIEGRGSTGVVRGVRGHHFPPSHIRGHSLLHLQALQGGILLLLLEASTALC